MDQRDHNISMDDTKILEVELKWFERGVKVGHSIQPSHNKDGGTWLADHHNLPIQCY